MLSKQQYVAQLFEMRNEYRQDNAWVGQWDESWNDDAVMTKFIGMGYNLYAATARNALKLTVLGGTEIRLDDAYIRNFGVTAANGIQDLETQKWVDFEMKRRADRARLPHAKALKPSRTVTPVMGVGSILSEKGWTPILNDSLILGAITAGQQFALGLTPAEQVDWNAMNGAKANKTAVLAARFGDTVTLTNAWKSFFNSQRRMFFFPWGGPRVFTREILGLYFFGYKPEFSWQQLGFYPGSGRRDPADFGNYLRKLRGVGFQNKDQVNIMRTILSFLFNDPKAIGFPWAGNTKTEV